MGQGAEKGEESLSEVWEEDWAGFHIHLQVSVWVCCVRVGDMQCDLCPFLSGVEVCSAPFIAMLRPTSALSTTRARAGR